MRPRNRTVPSRNTPQGESNTGRTRRNKKTTYGTTDKHRPTQNDVQNHRRTVIIKGNEGTTTDGSRESNRGTNERNGQTYKRNNKKKNTNRNFKGMATEMNGHVFQVHFEQHKREQYEETIAALEIYA